ncbi:MAG: DUF1194 domain-containing protein [Janthinobacterium lividum]
MRLTALLPTSVALASAAPIPAAFAKAALARAATVLAALAFALPHPARGAEPVDIALVLVSDVSRSIDDSEFLLEKNGYASAFTNPKVMAAIRSGPAGGIAVAYVEFAGEEEVSTVLDWTVLRDDASIHRFVERLEATPRSARGRTAISAGIDAAVALLAHGAPESGRQVIDVAGDGTNNAGRPAATARAAALAAGITVNGLAIINDHPASYTYAHTQPPGGLDAYYRENVAGGPASFVLTVHDLNAFGDAMTRKLISEIAVLPTPGPTRG